MPIGGLLVLLGIILIGLTIAIARSDAEFEYKGLIIAILIVFGIILFMAGLISIMIESGLFPKMLLAVPNFADSF